MYLLTLQIIARDATLLTYSMTILLPDDYRLDDKIPQSQFAGDLTKSMNSCLSNGSPRGIRTPILELMLSVFSKRLTDALYIMAVSAF
jgi:hypothetical protein